MLAERDPSIEALLDRVIPATIERPDWQRVLADAGLSAESAIRVIQPPRRRRPLVLVLSALLLLVVAPLTALAVNHGWWFFAAGAPKPLGTVETVTTGTWSGVPWTLVAYRSGTDGICFALTPHATTNSGGSGAAMSCDTITGVPVSAQSEPSSPHAISYLMGSSQELPAYITGPVVDTARTVEIVFADGKTIHVGTLPAPVALRSHVRFYVAELPARAGRVTAVLGRSKNGATVARLPVAALSSAIPAGAFRRVSDRGALVKLPAALEHAFRLAHRSTDIRLLARRDGRDFYRLGAGSCWGTGRPVDPASLPPTRRGVATLVGLIVCASDFPSHQQPVLDLSVYGQSRGEKTVTLVRLAGFASDAVRTIKLVDSRGRIVGRVPVVGNVYTLARAPKGVVIVEPADISGRPLAKCGPGAKVTSSGSYLNARC